MLGTNLTLLILLFTDLTKASIYKNNGAGLTTFPTDIPLNAVKIELKQNSLTTITSTDLASLVELQQIFLNENQITSISPDAFNNTKIHTIDLSYNPIKVVQLFEAIRNNLVNLFMSGCQISNATWNQEIYYSKLTNIKMEKNQITKIPDISRSAQSLQFLFLKENKIEVVDANELNQCDRLKLLSLGSNRITHVTGILELPNLDVLYLESNRLTHFPNISLLPQLGAISLKENDIQYIPNDSFVNNHKLRFVSMQKNDINQMPNLTAAKNSLEELALDYNPKIKSIPVDYFKGFDKLKTLGLRSTSISTLSFIAFLGPSLQFFLLGENNFTDVPADTFANTTGMTDLLIVLNYAMTTFDISNIR